MPSNVKLALVVTLIPVGPRKGAGQIGEQYFAVHLSAAFAEKLPAELPAETWTDLLIPWKSGWSVEKIAVKRSGGADLSGELSGVQKRPDALDGALTSLREKVVSGREPVWSPGKIDEPASPNGAGGPKTIKPALVEALHTLSTYPGSIPGESGVLHHFKVLGNWTPAAGEYVIAAPAFTLNWAGTAIKCEPAAAFTPADWANDWTGGWPYTLTPNVVGGVGLEMRAYVKPLLIKEAAAEYVKYDDDPTYAAGGQPVGPNFKDYWFRSQGVHPWTERLQDFSDGVSHVPERLRDARAAFENAPAERSAAWEDLQLMGLAFFAQWVAPQAGSLVKASDGEELLNTLAAVLKGANVKQELQACLDRFRRSLQGGARDLRRNVWLSVFRRAFGDAGLSAQDVLRRFHEGTEEFDLLLFYAWDYAVSASPETSEALKKSWDSAFSGKRAEQEKFFLVGDGKKFGLKTVRGLFEAETFNTLVGQPTFDATKEAIVRRLGALRQSFEDAEYVPHLVSVADLGQAEWNLLWKVWSDGDTGYVKRFAGLLVDPPRTEGKPSGLTIQFDRLERRSGSMKPKDNSAAWRKVGGVGVLVREAADTEQEWHLVSAATMSLRGVRVRGAQFVGSDMKAVRLHVEVAEDAPVEPYDLDVAGKPYRGLLAVKGAAPSTSPDLELTPSVVTRGGPVQTLLLTSEKPFEAGDLKKIGFMRLLTDPALTPVRVPYRGGVRYPLLTYNQRSLVAPTALADAVRDYFTAAAPNKLAPEAVFDYGPARNGNTLYNLVPLKFGRKFQMAAFMIDTAGGLPAALAKGVPWVVTDTKLPTLALPDGVAVQYAYWRKVPVGHVRVSALAGADFAPVAWPEISAGVSPLAWETKPNKATTGEAQHKRKSQLALLHDGAPAAGSFSFGVKLPTVDIDTLERWLPAAEKEHLGAVLTGYFKHLSQRRGPVADAKSVSEDEDLMLDDPAVEQLLFVLEHYDFDAPAMKWKVVDWHTLPVAPDPNQPGLSRHQRPWVRVLCRRTEQGGKPEVRAARPAEFPAEAAHDVVAVVQKYPVSVSRLRVFALVPERFVEGEEKAEPRFERGFFEMFEEDGPSKGEKLFVEDFDGPESGYNLEDLGADGKEAFRKARAGFKCLKPHTILLETPNDELPADTELWRKLSLELTGAGRDVVAVSLRKDDAATRAALRNVVRCELLRQQWRWQGYPFEHEGIGELRRRWIPREPRGDAVTADGPVAHDEDEDFLVWELKAFADMHDAFDTLTIPLPYTHESPELIYEDSFEKDLLSRYVRYGLRIFSRYEPLFRRTRGTALPVTTAQPRAVGGKESKLTGVGWRRSLVRYRGPRPLKPIVQAIVPLTLASGAGGAAPLLLVLDETMFSQSGVTEWVECEVVKVALPSTDKSKFRHKVACGNDLIVRERLHQTGHDPLVTADNAACALPDPEAVTIRPRLTGPFGHTKDTGARQPLFARSSFMVEPSHADSGWRARSWDFAKVRFRRLSGDDLLDDDAGEGKWTEPVWVQFLPSSNFDVPEGAGGASLTVTWDVAAKRVSVGTTSASNPLPVMKQFAMFKYCLLLTHQVKDFRGQGRYEVYHDCVSLAFAADDRSLLGAYDAAPDPESKAVLTGRLVEVQAAPVKPGAGSSPHEYEDLPEAAADGSFSQKFWAALFDAPEEGAAPNAKYRVTRVSSPIGVVKR